MSAPDVPPHDAIGAVPPTAAEAADKVASLRRTMVSSLPMHTAELLGREVDITVLGRLPARFDTAASGDGAA